MIRGRYAPIKIRSVASICGRSLGPQNLGQHPIDAHEIRLPHKGDEAADDGVWIAAPALVQA